MPWLIQFVISFFLKWVDKKMVLSAISEIEGELLATKGVLQTSKITAEMSKLETVKKAVLDFAKLKTINNQLDILARLQMKLVSESLLKKTIQNVIKNEIKSVINQFNIPKKMFNQVMSSTKTLISTMKGKDIKNIINKALKPKRQLDKFSINKRVETILKRIDNKITKRVNELIQKLARNEKTNFTTSFKWEPTNNTTTLNITNDILELKYEQIDFAINLGDIEQAKEIYETLSLSQKSFITSKYQRTLEVENNNVSQSYHRATFLKELNISFIWVHKLFSFGKGNWVLSGGNFNKDYAIYFWPSNQVLIPIRSEYKKTLGAVFHYKYNRSLDEVYTLYSMVRFGTRAFWKLFTYGEGQRV